MTSKFFNAKSEADLDRLYNADDFASFWRLWLSNGIYSEPANGMQVYAQSGMTLGILAGACCINGYTGNADGSDTVTLSYGSSSYYRYDAVCARLDLSERDIHIAVIKGTNSATLEDAVKPTPVRDSLTHDIILAYVEVDPGATTLNDTKITDMRPDNDVCGFVSGIINQFSSTNFFRQYSAMLDELLAGLGEDDHITIDWTDSTARTKSDEVAALIPLEDLFKFI